MFSKRRNLIAGMLLILGALSWTYGRSGFSVSPDTSVTETSTAVVEMTEASEGSSLSQNDTEEEEPEAPAETATSAQGTDSVPGNRIPDRSRQQIIGRLLCLAGAAAAATAIFFLWQETPFFGPDGAAFLLAAARIIGLTLPDIDGPAYLSFLLTFTVLLCVRELWGWIRMRLSLSCCLVRRAALRCRAALPCRAPQWSLLIYTGWIIAALILLFLLMVRDAFPFDAPALLFTALAGGLGILCLRKYGAELGHFMLQLDNFQNGLPIAAKEGTFGEAETQLLNLQARHEEAVRTAVTSERFKVELISNVSHDLRTPLTSILGYGELLRKEELSPAGKEQLRALNQKAGYMRDLVEALFELTKVSSGVMECKKESIDLIRLLEQTIGLFDDQLTNAGLSVRRQYESDSVMIVTDGSRMHQVFANLLENAIKYALSGTRIYLEVREKEDGFQIRLVNTSSYEMDFKPEEILQRFARGDKARSTKGSGLGLAIARTYTESVGGRFHVAIDGDQFGAFVFLPKTERNL